MNYCKSSYTKRQYFKGISSTAWDCSLQFTAYTRSVSRYRTAVVHVSDFHSKPQSQSVHCVTFWQSRSVKIMRRQPCISATRTLSWPSTTNTARTKAAQKPGNCSVLVRISQKNIFKCLYEAIHTGIISIRLWTVSTATVESLQFDDIMKGFCSLLTCSYSFFSLLFTWREHISVTFVFSQEVIMFALNNATQTSLSK